MGGVAWTEEEDHLLKRCIEQYGEGKWRRVPQLAGLNRCRKSCRLRWLNYLRPNIKRGSFTEEEVDLIIQLHSLLGNRWSLIAGRLPGRTANDVKNYWNCHLSKKLDPQQISNHEDNDLNTKDDIKILCPSQPRDFAASSGGWTQPTTVALKAPSSAHGPMPEEIGTSPSPPPKLYADQDELNNSNPPFFEEDGHVLGDLGMDLQFDGSAGLMQSSNQWDWDDLISDLDLWG
ncbi:hypothetical protein EUGRSUZ_H04157 [Eucalyptus grandis]|uniref:Uncharacterized protein n=2 Tax=Eucalyptus grandis TaxID=71139 RepID=A0A059B607_EUCGR|nr:hypothetical protein EUGRSUZ_H04157 [Eucalyptus grandis]